jgi:phospholipid transport system substrate-binding protein
MISRRSVLAAALLVGTGVAAVRGAAATPTATISAFYDTLLATMKDGPKLGFNGRSERLAPAIRSAFDLPLMTRLMVGPSWQSVDAKQQEQLVAAFSDFSIATYASRFDDYSGERFEIDAKTAETNNGTIVHTKLVKSDGEPVQLDYLMRKNEAGWQIVDVYLSGTVSELATRRSEFSAVMRRGGAEALVDALQKKTAQLRS